MSLFQRILRRVFAHRDAEDWPRRAPSEQFALDVHTVRSIKIIAEREQRSPGEVASQILDDALRNHLAQEENWQRWRQLTQREQEITALVCLNYTTRQIASRLQISPTTVKSHVERILLKYNVAQRNDLRMLLNGWDFSAWDR
jgi:DNA-binding CsgD family transcriptional regulator